MSQSLDDLKNGLKLVDSLKTLEVVYSDPPLPSDADAAMALRGGAIVLIVANFENYIKERMKEFILQLSSFLTDRRSYDFEKLPQDLVISHYFLALEYAMKGSRHERIERIDRINDIHVTAIDVAAKNLDPIAFSQTGGNPSSSTISSMMKSIGIRKAFEKLQPHYEIVTGSAVFKTFIEDKLAALIVVRNEVAHTANILNVSRRDIADYRDFVLNLSISMDILFNEYAEETKAGCKIP